MSTRKLDRFKNLKQDSIPVPAKDNPLIFAFWTCLQLERYVCFIWLETRGLTPFSDIVAELPCPHSGILTYEENMPSPNIVEAVKDGFEEKIVSSYQGQLYLRKHLNRLHNMFYKPDNGMYHAISLYKDKLLTFYGRLTILFSLYP